MLLNTEVLCNTTPYSSAKLEEVRSQIKECQQQRNRLTEDAGPELILEVEKHLLELRRQETILMAALQAKQAALQAKQAALQAEQAAQRQLELAPLQLEVERRRHETILLDQASGRASVNLLRV